MEHSIASRWQQEYPRPQHKRNSFFCLNGEWELNGLPIQVPFPPEAPLAHYPLPHDGQLCYQKQFSLPAGFARSTDRVLLHFGAVDQIAEVVLNGQSLARHKGGYLPFSVDITEALLDENQLTVNALDTLSTDYPYGKQCKKRGGMWYTPVSGIWQTVWIEAVPPHAVNAVRITPSLTGIALSVETDAPEYTIEIPLKKGLLRRTFAQKQIEIDLLKEDEIPHLWTPQDPFLYPLFIETETDRIESYFALRTVQLRSIGAQQCICLNGEPLFLHGVLDQGYFADGIYLPEQPVEYERDVARMQELGFNLLRKHIKVEPETFYYACDRSGMLVLQDMVNSGSYHYLKDTVLPTLGFLRRADHTAGEEKRKAFFEAHALATQQHLYNHPCIIGYTIFNEGWGQFDADRIYRTCKAADPTRFYDATSGWFAQQESDLDSRHLYFRTKVMRASKRPLFLSECGGYARPVPGHLFQPNAKYGYGTVKTQEALTERIDALYRKMVLPSIPLGLCGCIYTQLSDVEDEINGMYTYDRNVCKVDTAQMQTIANDIFAEFHQHLKQLK